MGYTKKFGGKVYALKNRVHSKREAQAYAKQQRKLGKMARITSDRAGGHLNYDVWVRD